MFVDGHIGDALPTTILARKDIEDDISIAQLFIKSGLLSSGKEVKRHIADGSIKVNGINLTESNNRISDLNTSQAIKLSVGKKRHAVIKIS